MELSKIYHGGGVGKRGFPAIVTPVDLTDVFIYNFSKGEAAVVVDSLIPACADVYAFSNGNGHYVVTNQKVKSFGVMVPKYVTNAVGQYCRFQIKTIVADGSRVADIDSSSGVNLINYDLVFPNSGGASWYYKGGGLTGQNLQLNAGEMVFVVVCSKTATNVYGASFWIQAIED